MLRPLLVVACLLCAVTRADEVVLVSGGRLSCEVLEETESGVTVRLPNGKMTIPRSRIASIRRESSGEYLLREARRSLKQGMYESAVELFAKALELDPDDEETLKGYADALLDRARELLEQYRLDEADALLRRLEALSGTNTAALRERMLREAVFANRLHELGRKAIARS